MAADHESPACPGVYTEKSLVFLKTGYLNTIVNALDCSGLDPVTAYLFSLP